jgi:hypothetical protein
MNDSFRCVSCLLCCMPCLQFSEDAIAPFPDRLKWTRTCRDWQCPCPGDVRCCNTQLLDSDGSFVDVDGISSFQTLSIILYHFIARGNCFRTIDSKVIALRKANFSLGASLRVKHLSNTYLIFTRRHGRAHQASLCGQEAGGGSMRSVFSPFCRY